jgi:RimJ/RimL family protein N-acetyltransferase
LHSRCVIRRPTVDDIDALRAFFGQPERAAARWRYDIEQRMPDGGLLLLSAWLDGVLVGYARAAQVERPAPKTPHQAPPGWYLIGVNVRRALRRQGLGARLTELRMAWLAQHAETLWFTTTADNAASIALHERYGFEVVGRDINAPGEPRSADRILFRRVVDALLRASLPPAP